MNETEALKLMVSPSTPRPSIWRKGVLQIWVTRACDKACFHCTQNSQLAGKPNFISVEHFEQAVLSIKGYFGVVGMFGGNPALHPQFETLCQILAKHIPFEQRGIWCNNPMNNGLHMAATFNPAVSNLNVHQSIQAWDKFVKDWPQSKPYLKGLNEDSRHGPTLIAMKDIIPDEEERWNLIANCDINKYWSAMLCVVKGNLKAYFCEIAAAHAMLHENDSDWPDTGMEASPGWWQKPMQDFADQVRWHCHRCGIPLKGFGSLANQGPYEQYSKTHASVMKPKSPNRETMLIESLVQLGDKHLPKSTDYIENGSLE